MAILFPSAQNIALAVEKLRVGGLVAFPTETVYGLGADAENPAAVASIYQAKGRPQDHPVIVHVAQHVDMAHWAQVWPNDAQKLVAAFWPGPLTLIVKRNPAISAAVSGGQDSIGLRCPAHPVAQALLQAFGGGIAAPSANRFGRISPTTAQHVQNELGEAVDCILDGGSCAVGIESTIVDLSRGRAVLLRPGQITRAQLEQVLGHAVERADAEAPRASGMLESHYAPTTPLRLMTALQLQQALAARVSTGLPVAVYSHSIPQVSQQGLVWCVAPADALHYAQRLYADLRWLDQQQCQQIWVESVPDTLAWQGIADRLRRAAA